MDVKIKVGVDLKMKEEEIMVGPKEELEVKKGKKVRKKS